MENTSMSLSFWIQNQNFILCLFIISLNTTLPIITLETKSPQKNKYSLQFLFDEILYYIEQKWIKYSRFHKDARVIATLPLGTSI